MNPFRIHKKTAGALLFLCLLFNQALPAQTFVWALNGNWNVDGNWNIAGFPNGTTQNAWFLNVITANRSINLGQNVTTGFMLFSDNNNYTINGGGNNLTLDLPGAGGNALIFSHSAFGNGAHTVNAPVNLIDDNLLLINFTTSALTQGGALNNNGNLVMITSAIGNGNVVISGNTSGAGGLTKFGINTAILSGSNTYTGLTTVNTGNLNLNSAATAVPGDLTIGNGGGGPGADIVQHQANDQIADTSAVTINSTGRLDLNNFDDTIGSLTSASGTAQVFLGSGTLTVGDATNTTFAGVISETGNLVKEGNGTLTLSNNNTYSGTTTVNDGILAVSNAGALGNTTGATSVNSGGTLDLTGGISVVDEDLDLAGTGESGVGALRGVSGSNTWNGDVTLTADATVTSNIAGTTLTFRSSNFDSASIGANTLTIDGAGDTFFNSQIDSAVGAGNLVKNGTGTAELNWGGAAGPMSSHEGTTTVNAGMLILNLGNGTTPSLDGTITVGDGAGTDTLRTEWFDQIGDSTTVNVNSSGVFEVSAVQEDASLGGDLNETIGALNLQGGSLVTTTNGGTNNASLVLNDNVTHDGTGSTSATISGDLSLGGATRTFDVADSAVASDLVVSADIIDGGGASGITKTGTGTLELTGANTFTGRTTINDGIVRIGADNNLGTAPGASVADQLTIDGGTLGNSATLTLDANRGVTLNAGGGTFEARNLTTLTVDGVITGAGALTKTGAGTLELVNTGNDWTGGININAGTVLLSTSEVIANANNMSLGGGTLNTNDFDETLSTLTLNASSNIDLGSVFADGSLLNFGGGTHNAGQLFISNWNGVWATGGGTDQIVFGTGLSQNFLNNVFWVDLGHSGAYQLPTGEIVPVPEPTTIFGASLLCIVVGFDFYRRKKAKSAD